MNKKKQINKILETIKETVDIAEKELKHDLSKKEIESLMIIIDNGISEQLIDLSKIMCEIASEAKEC